MPEQTNPTAATEEVEYEYVEVPEGEAAEYAWRSGTDFGYKIRGNRDYDAASGEGSHGRGSSDTSWR